MKKRQAALITIESNSIEETEAIGRRLGQALTIHLVVALKGELGAGKTTLTRGIVAGLGIQARVTSPTFTLINEYVDDEEDRRLIHMDSYRLGEDKLRVGAEVATLGIDEILDEVDTAPDHGLTMLVIEWADRVSSLLPEDHLEVRLDYREPIDLGANDNRRIITLIAHGARSAHTLAAFRAAQPVHFRPQ